ncbi:MAG: extracellular solute-binding protein [Chloroflexi bacterium]|nr:extracellular solute-binding protein [Chloroflexota bacterium]
MFTRIRSAPVLSAITGVALLASACSPAMGPADDGPAAQSLGQNKEPDNEITVWYFDKLSMDTAIPLFEQAHPGVKVNFVLQPFGDMSQKYLAALAAKQGVPDVIGLDTSMVGRFLDAGDNLLADPYNAGQYQNDFVDWKFNAPITQSGEMAAFPWDVATGVMFYRPDVFQAAGLPTEPAQVSQKLATWDDFIQAGQQIKAATNGQSSIVANEKDIFNAAFWQNGGTIAKDGTIEFVDEAQQPLDVAVKAKQAQIGANIATWSERWMPALKSGQVATVIMGAWMLGDFQNLVDPDGAGTWRIATAPGGAFNNGGTYLQVPKLAQNKQLAWDFVQFVTTNADTQNAIFQKTGIVPAYKPAWNSPVYDQPVDYLGGQLAWRQLIELAQQVKPLAYSPVDALGTDLLNAEVDKAISGKLTSQQALLGAATQLQDRAQRASNLQLALPADAVRS